MVRNRSCRCQVNDGRVAVLDDGTCAALGVEVLFDDPVRAWLREASRVEWGEGDTLAIARRRGEAWEVESVDPQRREDMELLLARLEDWRAERLLKVEGDSSSGERIVLRRDAGVDVTLHVTPTTVRVVGLPWIYRGAAMSSDLTKKGPPNLGGL